MIKSRAKFSTSPGGALWEYFDFRKNEEATGVSVRFDHQSQITKPTVASEVVPQVGLEA